MNLAQHRYGAGRGRGCPPQLACRIAAASYSEDLAYIHHTGHGDYARSASPGLLQILKQSGVPSGRVVDLGCGSGIWAAELGRAGYDVLGVDISASMIRLARRNAPRAKFLRASLLSVRVPACDAVTSIGECVNYLFDERNSRGELAGLFSRVFEALRPGGVFVFDFSEPGQFPSAGVRRAFREGDDWTVLVDAVVDRKRRVLTRRIVSFRRIDKLFRRTEECHIQLLRRGSELLADVRAAGFRARLIRSIGNFTLPRAHAAIVARKPAAAS